MDSMTSLNISKDTIDNINKCYTNAINATIIAKEFEDLTCEVYDRQILVKEKDEGFEEAIAQSSRLTERISEESSLEEKIVLQNKEIESLTAILENYEIRYSDTKNKIKELQTNIKLQTRYHRLLKNSLNVIREESTHFDTKLTANKIDKDQNYFKFENSTWLINETNQKNKCKSLITSLQNQKDFKKGLLENKFGTNESLSILRTTRSKSFDDNILSNSFIIGSNKNYNSNLEYRFMKNNSILKPFGYGKPRSISFTECSDIHHKNQDRINIRKKYLRNHFFDKGNVYINNKEDCFHFDNFENNNKNVNNICYSRQNVDESLISINNNSVIKENHVMNTVNTQNSKYFLPSCENSTNTEKSLSIFEEPIRLKNIVSKISNSELIKNPNICTEKTRVPNKELKNKDQVISTLNKLKPSSSQSFVTISNQYRKDFYKQNVDIQHRKTESKNKTYRKPALIRSVTEYRVSGESLKSNNSALCTALHDGQQKENITQKIRIDKFEDNPLNKNIKRLISDNGLNKNIFTKSDYSVNRLSSKKNSCSVQVENVQMKDVNLHAIKFKNLTPVLNKSINIKNNCHPSCERSLSATDLQNPINKSVGFINIQKSSDYRTNLNSSNNKGIQRISKNIKILINSNMNKNSSTEENDNLDSIEAQKCIHSMQESENIHSDMADKPHIIKESENIHSDMAEKPHIIKESENIHSDMAEKPHIIKESEYRITQSNQEIYNSSTSKTNRRNRYHINQEKIESKAMTRLSQNDKHKFNSEGLDIIPKELTKYYSVNIKFNPDDVSSGLIIAVKLKIEQTQSKINNAKMLLLQLLEELESPFIKRKQITDFEERIVLNARNQIKSIIFETYNKLADFPLQR